MIIQTRHLVKHYGSTTALNDLTLAVRRGSLFAFLGPNGAGKSTTIRILNGLASMDGGEAMIDGIDVSRNPLAAKRLCGLAAQQVNLDNDLTLRENLDFHGRLYGMPRQARKSRIALLLEYVQLSDRADKLVKTLSGGMKRRVMAIRALLHEPKLLFLDEPTAGLDPDIRRHLWDLIRNINNDGVTVFLTTHYIEEAEFLADEVAFIHQGQLVRQAAPDAVKADLGKWAVDYPHEKTTQSAYFPSRDAAAAFAATQSSTCTVRPVNLEDAFLSLTGRRVS